jgi:hypothetical protein
MEEVISPDVISNLSEYDLFFKILKWDFKMFIKISKNYYRGKYRKLK